MRTLITGGAGFIGSRLARKLAAKGHEVTILDSLSPQIHGESATFSDELQSVAHCIHADIADSDALETALQNQEAIVHLAAETGTGQSMYAIERYSRTNISGTALMFDKLVNDKHRTVRKVVVASSRAVYGEGKYHCPKDGVVYPLARSTFDLEAGRFDPPCPKCGGAAQMQPTTEDTPFSPTSFYGLTKQVQEQATLLFGGVMGIDAFALRYQNVYGPGQSLVNPYTGILAVFSQLARRNKPINVFEDGMESRDFVYIDDVVDATAQCLDPDSHGVWALNVGSGVSTSVLEVARAVAAHFRSDIPITVSGNFRLGDIRHNVADISAMANATGYVPKWSFNEGLRRFLLWAESRTEEQSGFDNSIQELKQRGLMGSAASKQ